MKKFAILAYPAHHSLSPTMHNAVFSHVASTNEKEYVYGREEISPENLEVFMQKFKNDKNYLGLSVSIPHKETIVQLCDETDEAVKYIGAVNTVYKKNDKICGTNTDWIGFKKSLEKQYNPEKKRYIILGAGGASRAIIYALLQSNAQKIYIWNRTEKSAQNLVEHFSKISDKIFLAQTEKLSEISLKTDCIINTTSVGMTGKLENLSPFPKELFQPFHSAFDIVYTPKETVFLKDCKNAGGNSMSGEEMLLFQGAEQSKLFLGNKVSAEKTEETMRKALQLATRKYTNWITPHITSEQKQNILGTIIENKKQELFLSREFLHTEAQTNNLKIPENKKFRFYKKLLSEKKTPHVIAEIKPASPSKGSIFRENDTVENIAKMYEENNISCISVLTDFTFFGATSENLIKASTTTNIPLLRKDFIIDASQIIEAYYLGASAVLLMRSVLSSQEIEKCISLSKKYGLDCLVEVHDENELRDVLENTSANIIGINTRDLKTLKINPENFQALLKIAKTYPKFSEKIWIAESGISSKADILQYALEADAVLVGTGILLQESNELREKVLKDLV
ncbi:TPA: shikimate dehydrogenase [Candidatus Peregrinibacteria bacterium]|nr:shikimate dehydrogenase [Candidatus Peregrinibacteria bacterium]